MINTPVVTEYAREVAGKLDLVSDYIDEVNIYKGKGDFTSKSQFDSDKDKESFRQYEGACDRVKNFYAVSGAYPRR